MTSDPARASESAAGDPEIMASIDADGDASRLIIADITGNDRWVSTPARAALSLADWR